jgi:predicted acetylornithine/succinylornithine family transaminase
MTLQDLQALEQRYLMPTYRRNPVEFVRGKGSRLWDADGDEYLDFLCGISVTQLGHSHPGVVAAVTEQAARLMHVGNLYYTEPHLRLAQRLSERSIGGKVFFCNSGAEANECAIKLARRHKPGGEIVVLENAFHGRTLGALSATPQPDKQEPFAPLVPGFKVVKRDDPAALEDAVGPRTAAVFIEPIQGESGIHPIDPLMMRAARDACDREDALLVYDEIQCGTGRTGTLWGFESGGGPRPDVMTVAKGLGGGLPIGACITSPAYGDTFQPGDHGSTFPGGPVIASAAIAVLEVVDDEEFLAAVAAKGRHLAAGLRELPVDVVRGRGLMLAFDVDDAPDVARRLLLDQKLVVNATGPRTIRLLPALTVSDDEIDDALGRLRAAVAA